MSPEQEQPIEPVPLLAGPLRKGLVIWLAVSSFMAVLLLFMLGQFFVLQNVPLGLMMTSLLVFGAAGLFFPAALRLSPVAFTGLGPTPLRFIGLAFVVGLVNLPVPNYLMALSEALLPKDWSAVAEETTRLLSEASPVSRLMLVVAAGIAAPIGEELFFRGWLQNLLAPSFRGLPSVIVVAIVFSATHGDPVGFVARIELGVLFGLSRLWTGSLWPGITMHATHNIVSTAVLYLGDTPDEDAPIEWRSATLWMLAAAVVVVLLMAQFRQMTRRAAGPVVPTRPVMGLASRILQIDVALIVLCATGLELLGPRLPGAPLPEPAKPAHLEHGPSHLK